MVANCSSICLWPCATISTTLSRSGRPTFALSSCDSPVVQKLTIMQQQQISQDHLKVAPSSHQIASLELLSVQWKIYQNVLEDNDMLLGTVVPCFDSKPHILHFFRGWPTTILDQRTLYSFNRPSITRRNLPIHSAGV